MVAQQLQNYLENGNIINAVNFPRIFLKRKPEGIRITVAHVNEPGILNQITGIIAEHELNVQDVINQSRGDQAYTIVDIDAEKLDPKVVAQLDAMENTQKIRIFY